MLRVPQRWSSPCRGPPPSSPTTLQRLLILIFIHFFFFIQKFISKGHKYEAAACSFNETPKQSTAANDCTMTYDSPESYSILSSWAFFFFSPVVKLIEETLNINMSRISRSVKQSLLAERRGHQRAGKQPWPVICNQLLSTSPAHISAGHTSGGQDLVKSAPPHPERWQFQK